MAVHERLLPHALPSPPTWLAVGKRACVATSAVLQGPGWAGLLSWGISLLPIVFPLLVAEKENVGFAGKAKCTSHSPMERWVLDTRGWGDLSLGWLSWYLDAPMGAAVGSLQSPAAHSSQLAISNHCCPGASEPPAPGAGAVRGCRLTQCNTENPTAAAACWAPACLGRLLTNQYFQAEVRSLEELLTFWLMRWSSSFPWCPLLGTSVSFNKLSPGC